MAGRVVVIANRLPVSLKRSGDGWRVERSSGGLATAMKPILEKAGGLWIGWSGDSSHTDDAKRGEILRTWAERDRYFAVDLPAEIEKLYYEGHANQALWPLFHQFPMLFRFSPDAWAAYIEANRRFAEAALQHCRPGDLIWVHDYHLMLLPRMIREARPDANIGFFLHIPFPDSEIFRILPRREEILHGMLGADLIGFQTHSHLQHFRLSLLRLLGADSRLDQVQAGGRPVRIGAFPIGIAPKEFAAALKTKQAAQHRAELERRYPGERILIGVDRLDYTKGIPHRLRAYRRLLETWPELRGKVVLIQIAVPSREHIATYAGLQREVNELVGEINGQLSTAGWTPVVYIRRGVPRPQLAALYAAADVAWVTPLRDGMNLVAKEYVACKGEADGALVLSEFAGAAEDLAGAFPVNPYDEERTAELVRDVLRMPEQERRERMHALHSRVVRNDAFAWADSFLTGLREAVGLRDATTAANTQPLEPGVVLAAYRAAPRRALFLDYDGTLVPYAARPELAAPPPELIDLLGRLASDPANCLALVSGRRRRDLGEWFGGIGRIWLVAEHGALLRRPGAADWEPLRPSVPSGWKEHIRPILQHYVDRTPGSLIEEKEYAMVWHYRQSEPEFGDWLANELAATLEGLLAETEQRAVRGSKTVEVKPTWANKGEAVEHVLEACGRPDFRLAIGDDRTDEDMFARLDSGSLTVRVGDGATRARFTLADPAHVVELLRRLARPPVQSIEGPGLN